jgi:CxxC-x17-CxxC domain-containing protein
MKDQITSFAETNFRNRRRKFGIKTDDRRRHMYMVGKTGVGKTTLLENMAISDIRNGNGVAIVDPHGEFADKMIDFVPKSRVNDVIYFNPGDLHYPIALNVIERVPLEQRHLVASGLVGVFKKIWADSWGPRLEYLLRNTILSLLEYPNSTLLGIMRVLVDKEYRSKIIEKVEDPVVKSFWLEEFQKYPDRFLAEAVSPIQNKVGQFLTSPLIRNIVGQTKSTINIREVMDEGKILIMNLSKGRVGEDNSALLGAMMITRLQLAAMSRIEIPMEKRRDFYLYVDEFQNFATESFANILSEARKYRLNLILAHQYINQLEEPVRDAVFGNVGTLISFRVGAEDAEFLEKELQPEFNASDLVNLTKFDIYLKLMIDGIASRPFSATTLPPYPYPDKNCRDKVIRVSRERYTSRREEVEEKISKWSGVGKKALELEKKKNKKKLYEATCSYCGKKAKVPFKPDNTRPIYCDECLTKIQAGEIQPLKTIDDMKKKPIEKKNSQEELKKENSNQIIQNKEAKKSSHQERRTVSQKEEEKNRQALRNTLKDILAERDKN